MTSIVQNALNGANNVTVRRGITPLNTTPPPVPVPLRSSTPPPGPQQTSARSLQGVLALVAQAPTSGNGASVGTSSRTGAQGPAPAWTTGGGAPPSVPAGRPGLLGNVSPGMAAVLKIAPFVAAVFFANKGDYVLAAASAAAGVVAVVNL